MWLSFNFHVNFNTDIWAKKSSLVSGNRSCENYLFNFKKQTNKQAKKNKNTKTAKEARIQKQQRELKKEREYLRKFAAVRVKIFLSPAFPETRIFLASVFTHLVSLISFHTPSPPSFHTSSLENIRKHASTWHVDVWTSFVLQIVTNAVNLIFPAPDADKELIFLLFEHQGLF